MRRVALALLGACLLLLASSSAAFAASRLHPAALIGPADAERVATAAAGRAPGHGSWTVVSAELVDEPGPVVDARGRLVVDPSTPCDYSLPLLGALRGPGLLARIPWWPACGYAGGETHQAWVVELEDGCGRFLCATATVHVDAVHGLTQKFAIRLLV